jgi:thiamine biosynthesis lipoprotein
MGTYLEIVLFGEREALLWEVSEEIIRRIHEWERVISTWDPESELSGLNRLPPDLEVPISVTLETALRAGDHCYRMTGGAFDPGILALEELWEIRGEGRVPGREEIERILPGIGWRHLHLSEGKVRRGSVHLKIEEGGFGKGLALRDALKVFEERRGTVKGYLNFGGQILLHGNPRRISLSDPHDRTRPLLVFTAPSGSISTSSQGVRRIRISGKEYGHIFSPKTGYPIEKEGSLTVIAGDPLFADCLSTGLFIIGSQEQAEWLSNHPEISAISLIPEGKGYRVITTPDLSRVIQPASKGIKILSRETFYPAGR